MTGIKSIFIVVLLVASVFWLPAGDIDFQVTPLSDRAVLMTPGYGNANTIVLSTQKGLVVVDTQDAPGIITAMKKEIEKRFKRKDYTHVLITHHHYDHTDGNQVFNDAVIIGHENCAGSMKAFMDNITPNLKGFQRRIQRWKTQLAKAEKGSEQAGGLAVNIAVAQRLVDELSAADYVSTPPNKTFSDTFTLDMGDMTFKLYYFGSAHTDNDVIIHIPEEKLLIVGDLFTKEDPPYINPRMPKLEVSRWIKVLDTVLKDEKAVTRIATGHGGLMSRDALVLWRNYLRDLWQGVTDAEKKGLKLEEVQKLYSLKNKFAYLYNLEPTAPRLERYHNALIIGFWSQLKLVL